MRTIDVVVADVQIGKRLRRLNPEKVTALCESITEIGLRSPISVTEECLLIAGLHRLEAFKRLGMEKIPGVVFADEALDAELAQIDENLIRAELTVLERGEHLARRKEIYEARHPETKQGAQGRRGSGSGEMVSKSEINSFSEDAAAKTNQSRRTVEQEVQIAAGLSEEVKEQIRDTPTANSKTDLLKLSRLDPKTQRQVAGRLTSGKSKTVKDATRQIRKEELVDQDAPTQAVGYTLLCQDFRDTAPPTIDLIITDPPYEKEYLPLYGDLARKAAEWLPNGGSLVVMVGQSYLPEILSLMTPHLTYHWTLAYLTPGGQAVQLWQRNVNTFWKPVLWFVKGDYVGKWIGDVVKSAPNDNDKEHHEWGQSVSGMQDLVDRFVEPGQVVLDPCCGAGTTGIAVLQAGGFFIGIDKDEQHISISAARLANVGGI